VARPHSAVEAAGASRAVTTRETVVDLRRRTTAWDGGGQIWQRQQWGESVTSAIRWNRRVKEA